MLLIVRVAPSHHFILAWLQLLATVACQVFAEECKGSSSETCANKNASSSADLWCWEQDDWTFWKEKEYFLPDLWDHFECDDHYESPGPLYNQETWMNLRQVYHDVVGSRKSSIGSPVLEEDGFSVTVQVFKQSESKEGRSLFATQDIKKGEHIWSGLKQEAMFDNGVDFKRFLARIPVPIACDHLHYLGSVDFDDDSDSMAKDARISAILDDGAFFNTVAREEDAASDADSANAGCMPEWEDRHPGGCDQNLFALKDIRAGQEITIVDEEDADSNKSDGWELFDMGPFLAHQRDALEQMRQNDHLFNPWSHYNCNDDSVWTQPRPLYSNDVWMRFRQTYIDVVGSTDSSIGTEVNPKDGFVISTEVKRAPGKGRGLFAAEDIPRGQLIWMSSKQTASFESGEDFKDFLDLLEVDEACDIIQMSYVYGTTTSNEGAMEILTELDNMTFVNSVEDEDPDAGCLPEWEARDPGGCIMNVYALRDIENGEEILVDYSEMGAIKDGWNEFGIHVFIFSGERYRNRYPITL
jgi:hypothetical protein